MARNARNTRADTRADRQFLANTPGLTFTKPLDQLSPSYLHRLAQSIRRQEAAGVPVSRQAARGHVLTPEHGKGGRGGARPKLPAAPQEYRGGKLPRSKYTHATKPLKAPHFHKRTLNPPERLDLADGAIVTTHTDMGDLLHRLREVGDDRVVVSGYDCEQNAYMQLGVNRGHSRGWSANDMLDAWRKGKIEFDFEDWFIAVSSATDSDPIAEPVSIGRVCYWTVYVYPVNRHLRFQVS